MEAQQRAEFRRRALARRSKRALREPHTLPSFFGVSLTFPCGIFAFRFVSPRFSENFLRVYRRIIPRRRAAPNSSGEHCRVSSPFPPRCLLRSWRIAAFLWRIAEYLTRTVGVTSPFLMGCMLLRRIAEAWRVSLEFFHASCSCDRKRGRAQRAAAVGEPTRQAQARSGRSPLRASTAEVCDPYHVHGVSPKMCRVYPTFWRGVRPRMFLASWGILTHLGHLGGFSRVARSIVWASRGSLAGGFSRVARSIVWASRSALQL